MGSKARPAKPSKATAKPSKAKPSKPKGAPRGFKPITKSGHDQDSAAALMRRKLGEAVRVLESMEGMESKSRVHENKDGSVDGEWVVAVPKRMSMDDLSIAMEESFGRTAISRDMWISYGARYVIKEDDEVYRRNKGMNQVATKYHRAETRARVVKVFATLRAIMDTMKRKMHGRRPTQVFLRLSWNPEDAKPTR